MVRAGPPGRKGRMSRFGVFDVPAVQGTGGAVSFVTCATAPDPSEATRGAEPTQPWMNCICVPASSITSPFFSGMASPATAEPLTVGRVLPST